MKQLRIILYSFLFLFILNANSAEVKGKSLKAYFEYCRFKSYEVNKGYLELYLLIEGNSLKYSKNSSGNYSCSAFCQIEISDKDGIRYFDKFNLISPFLKDTLVEPFLLKTQKRILLPYNSYKIKLTLQDNEGAKKEYNHEQEFELMFSEELLSISDIQLIDTYKKTEENNERTRNGYEMNTYMSDFYPSEKNILTFYCEIYNMQKVLGENEDFLIINNITNSQTGRTIADFSSFSKKKAQKVCPLLKEIKIDQLPSGNYHLFVEVKDKNNRTLLNKNLFFQRSNKALDEILETKEKNALTDISGTFVLQYNEQELNEYMKFLRPVSEEKEVTRASDLLRRGSFTDKQKFFLSFWKKREPLKPEVEWNDYLLSVNYVNSKYKSPPLQGYETDRGRIFLKYKAPVRIVTNENDMERVHGTYMQPYEIWHYYKAGNETNRIFVFFQRNIGSDFVLIHSDVKGEITNYQWKKEIAGEQYWNPQVKDREGDKEIYKGDR